MNQHDRKVIEKMLNHIEHILDYTKECDSMEIFSANNMLVEACVFNLMQIGELAHTELSSEAKESLTSIPWREIYGMRNRIVHGYEEVNLMIVWETIRNNLPDLKDELQAGNNI